MIYDPEKIQQIIESSFRQPKTVSVLINSRNRIGELKETITSLFNNASYPSDVEVIVRLDEDDAESVSRIGELPIGTRVIVGPRHGYKNAHLGYYEMHQVATGEFSMIYADDFFMSPGWDDYIRRYRHTVAIVFSSGELTMGVHHSIPLIWEKFGISMTIEIQYKIIALELGIYTRHDELVLTHAHRGAVRDYVEDLSDFMWPGQKHLIYELTDAMKPFVCKLERVTGPITGVCNSWGHPVNDWARGKVYWWPILPDVCPAYWKIKEAANWFHPGARYHYEGE